MSAAIERPNYLQCIDDALENRFKLASAIEALTAETHSRYLTSDVQQLIQLLRSDTTSEQFVNDANKAVWLPILLRARASSSSSTSSGEEFKLLLNNLISVTEARRNAWSQFAYPLVMLVISIAFFVLLATTIVPTFQKMFLEFALKLPAATKLLMDVSTYLRTHPVLSSLWLIGLVVVVIVIRQASQWVVRHVEGFTFLGVFLSGNTGSVRAMGRFTATLAELLQVGAPLAAAIAIAGRASQNPRFARTSAILSNEVGLTASIPLGSTVVQNFPALVIRGLTAGPNASPSIPLLRQLSSNYFERVRQRFEWSEGLFAPMTIVLIGLFVGFTVISLFMPLISLITALS